MAGSSSWTREELNEQIRDAPPPAAEDVSITTDGRRLDSKEAVFDFVTELHAACREAES